MYVYKIHPVNLTRARERVALLRKVNREVAQREAWLQPA